ncbi:MAG: PAS domain S-box protein [bacterium]|nr:PAS domain S-box protein [bacterium]
MNDSGQFQSIVEHLSVPLVVVRAVGETIRYANQAAEDAFGRSRGVLVGLPIGELFFDPAQFQRMIASLTRHGQVARSEARVHRADGTSFAVAVASESGFFDGEPAIVTTFHDLTELRRVEDDLKITAQVEKLLSTLSTRFIPLGPDEIEGGLEEALEEIAAVVLADSGFVALLDEQHRTVRRVLRWVSETVGDRSAPAWEKLLSEELDWLLEEAKSREIIQLSSRPDAGELPPGMSGQPAFSLVIVPIVYDQALRALLGVASIHQGKRWARSEEPLKTVAHTFANVLQRRDAEARLRRNEEALAAEKERLAVTLSSIADGVIATDRDSRIVLFNSRAAALTGWGCEDAVGRQFDEVFHRHDEGSGRGRPHPVRTVLEKGGIVGRVESQLVAADGSVRPIEESAAPIRGGHQEIIGAVLVFGDVTERRQAEKEREKANKLEAVGILAGGIAHDFRNILLIIQGNASLARYCLDTPEDLEGILYEIEKAGNRAKDLTEQLLTFSKGGAPVKARISIGEIIRESVKFCFSGSKVICEPEICDDLWQVNADGGQINQVLNNLLINATQAMSGGGRVRLTAENVDPDSAAGLGFAGGLIRVAVADEGVGIPPEDLSRIFDPYFTTKEEGTGLGLATAHSIVKSHDGLLLAESTPGEGSTFTMVLPAYLPSSGQLAISREPGIEELALGHGRILVVDDEAGIRQLTLGMLTRLGYQTDAATDGAEAIEKYRAAQTAGSPFDAVLMDLTIPGGLGGREAVTQLRSLDPQAKVVVSSGYSKDPVMADYKSFGFAEVLPKPFVITHLGQVLKRVLAPEEPGADSP